MQLCEYLHKRLTFCELMCSLSRLCMDHYVTRQAELEELHGATRLNHQPLPSILTLLLMWGQEAAMLQPA